MTVGVELITVGKILKPFGVRGQVRVQSLTDVPGRLEGLREVTVVTPSGSTLETKVIDVRSDGRSYLFRLAAFTTPAEARDYCGAWLQVAKGEVPSLPEDHHYQFKLIGLTVVDDSGKEWGVLEEVLEKPGQDLFVVRGGGREILIPASRKWVIQVDIPGRTMTVRSVEELLMA
ncbi:MAG: ribosome maturation factor RimM [Nitrospirales bacterium]